MAALDEIVFTFADAHNAVNGEKALAGAGLAVRVMPRPAVLGEGCGICLRVGLGDRYAAAEILQKMGVTAEACYRREKINGETIYRRL